ncbi:glycosyltransferase [Bipolaris maydis]|uniref:glycosyltransferase n=1 Tax=Cochliobolus heterostrophus TaxID=5016 RepID=UPI0024DA0A32|nr:glycosyltransferase [Bipolaris maydis]
MASNPLQNPSLPSLPQHQQNDTGLTSALASRYHAHLPIAHLSSQGIVAINTCTDSSLGVDGGKEGSAQQAAEDLSQRAYTRLGQRSEDQAVVFLGESGAGKTTIRGHMLRSFLSYSSTPLSKKIEHANFVFDAFTTTKSLTTPQASKSGLLLELQYNTATASHATLLGAQFLAHRLERSRIASVPTGERTYHVLYYLLAGTSPNEKKHLFLDAIGGDGSGGNRASIGANKRWRYLGHPTQLKVGIDDAKGFADFKSALRRLEFGKESIAGICEVMATILHIGQLEFEMGQNTTPAPDESGGYSHDGGESITVVKNKEALNPIAQFLGVSIPSLEQSLRYKSKTLYRERVTVMLDPKGARANADELARSLYSLLVTWVMEQMNSRISVAPEDISNTVSLVDFPGFANFASTGSALDQLLNNTANESLISFCQESFFQRQIQELEAEEISLPPMAFYDNTAVKTGLMKPGNGLLSILDDQMRRGKTDMQFLEAIRKRSLTVVQPGSNFPTPNTSPAFTIRHFTGDVDYSVEGLLEENAELISGDMMHLLKSAQAPFIQQLFGQEALQKMSHPKEKSTIVQATVSSKPTRQPSMAKRKADKTGRFGRPLNVFDEDAMSDAESTTSGVRKPGESAKQTGAAGQFISSLRTIESTLRKANPYFVFCLKPNDRRIANQFDSKCVRQQVQALGIAEISQRLRVADYSIFMPFAEFLGLAQTDLAIVGSDKEKAEMVLDQKPWRENEVRCWLEIANISGVTPYARGPVDSNDNLHTADAGRSFGDARAGLLSPSPGGYYDDKGGNYFGARDVDARSEAPSGITNGDMFHDAKLEELETVPVSGSRKRWVFVVYLMTWLIPDWAIRVIGRIPRKDVRTAWREKLAINMIIWWSCAFVIFLMIGFPRVICPKQNDNRKSYVGIRGVVYDLGSFIPHHYPSIVPQKNLEKYAGKDITNLFPSGQGIDPAVQLNYKNSNYSDSVNNLISATDLNAQYHDFRYFTNDSRPDWWYEQQMFLKANYLKGHLGYSPQYLKTLASKSNAIAYMNGKVYDLTDYIPGGRQLKFPPGQDQGNAAIDTNFMEDSVVDIFRVQAGKDISKYWDNLPLNAQSKSNMLTCLNNLFYVGDLDTRNSARCQFATYFLLAISVVLAAIIAFKFLAALQFSRKTDPENLDKFIIATVPAYTEDEESLRRAIDSAARMKYDDKRKLLVIVCDGMIIGQGNDKPTPRIVLDILGVPEATDPDPLSFESLGEGQRQHNMGKIYSGLYEVHGHIVPFMVIVKVGKPSEVSKPGNRGKRDSQIVLMRFLNRVHYNLPMSPLELEMHHHIRNIIGVNPTFYEFLLQIDADTEIAPDSATRFVAAFLHDTRLLAICGETALSNAKSSFVTMMQVYEYFISHNLTKAFESLFGSVTCLPGCFTMYRIRAAETGKPLFVSKEVVEAYQEIRVDTLHTKNLLHLGEDRYLTTLLIKFHPKYKTKYTMRAHAWTVAPDTFSVFISQRRRWINSTVHNLVELIPLQQLCGFCCFSMRFIPVIIVYIGYLVYVLVYTPDVVPITAFILLGAIYGLQAIIFIVRRKWEMIGWMIIYLFATPVFSFALPLYSFWFMDDFSWGNTRLIVGEKGQNIVVSDEGKFDPASIPKKRWEEYQAEMWEQHTIRDDRSEVSGYTYATRKPFGNASVAGSEYGGMAPSRSMSHLNLPRYDNHSRLSLAHSGHGMDSMEMANLPSDEAILVEIKDILSKSDLMNVTKKQIKSELEQSLIDLDVISRSRNSLLKKGNKKAQDDDWEAELGETVAPQNGDAAEAKPEDAAAEDDAAGGGLMAALAKRGKKKNKKGANPDVEGEDPPADSAGGDFQDKAPQEGGFDDDDDDVFAGNYGKKKGKGGATKAEEPAEEKPTDAPRVKTKAEKEKEKKEKEKQRKKELAAKKKASGPAKAEPAKAAESKPAAAAASTPAPAAEAAPAAGGKKKKINPALAALQKQQEERRKREEEIARAEAEERERLLELERQEAEEQKRKEEAKALKKQKEKEKIEQLKKEGKYMTKAQKEAKARNELRLQQLLEQGNTKVAGLADEPEKKKKPVYDDRKKKKKGESQKEKEAREAEEAAKKMEELRLAEEQAAKAAEEAEKARLDAEAKKGEDGDSADDWEAQADELDGVKDSWDVDTDEEEERKANEKKAKEEKAAAEKAAAEEAKKEDSESDSEEDSDDSSEDEQGTAAQRAEAARKAAAAERRKQAHEEALAARSKDNLRSPICCILGHVDTGKTKLLDKIRQTNVQEGEAGGITQQIGATYFPVEALQKKTAVVNKNNEFVFNVPGLLVIDTPGHESFTNLRSRGSSLCNIAILVIDIMHGLEPQTIESMKLLRDRRTPFIVALNKIDRLFGWKKIDNNGFEDSFSLQKQSVQSEFEERWNFVRTQLQEQGFNSELFFKNKNMSKYVSGIPDMIKLIVKLTQERLTNNLMYLSEVECLGTTIDVILSNGVLHEGDRIVLCGNPEPIATNIRALLTPAEMKELRVKSQYVHNKEVKAAMAIAGSRLLVVGPDDDEEDLMDEVSKTGRGVSVQASTLGSLEALLEFLRVSKIPVSTISIGPVFRKDAKEYAVMLCFDVKVDKEAKAFAEEIGVKIFEADIIYHLFDKKEESKMLAVFPCVLKPVAVFNKTNPIIIGVDVVEGALRMTTPICAIKKNAATGIKEIIQLGRVTSIERDHKPMQICKKGQPSVAVKIEASSQPMYGRHLEEGDTLYSAVSRKSIDTLKEFFRSDVSQDEWKLIVQLKQLFDIQ